jgi:UDP-glucose 4-epimerase
MDLNGKRVLVTGGAGFIGSHTTSALIERGANVTIVDDLSTGCRENIHPRAEYCNINIADGALDEIIAREAPEIIYHFAFHVLVPRSVKNPLLDMDALKGSVGLLDRAAHSGVKRVVFASSGFLYGNTSELPVTEEQAVQPVTPYAIAKHTVESYLAFFRNTYSLPYTVLRYAAVYGPGQVTGAMADYIRKLAAGEQAEMWGDGRKTRDYVYVSDVVNANLLALDVPLDYPDPIFNIGTGIETSLNTLYGKIAAILGVEANPIYHEDRPGEQVRYCLNYRKAKMDLGWEPAVGLDAGLRATISAATTRHFEPAAKVALHKSSYR